jgi:hypothetical protein
MLDDCFQLISLAYLTIGKNHEPPAVYVTNVLCEEHVLTPATGIRTFLRSK